MMNGRIEGIEHWSYGLVTGTQLRVEDHITVQVVFALNLYPDSQQHNTSYIHDKSQSQ